MLDDPSAMAFARSSLYVPVRLFDRPPEVSDPDRSLEAFDGGREPDWFVPLLSLLSWLLLPFRCVYVTGGGFLSLLGVRCRGRI